MAATATWNLTLPNVEAHALSPILETSDVALAARGDARAFARLYDEHKGRVMAIARRMTGPERAAELTQDVFVRAWQKLGTFRGEARFSTWLHRLAVNLILSRRASWATERARFLDDADTLESLAARRPRTVFVLHDVEGWKHDEIARTLGVTSGTTKAQLHRARMLLRRTLA